jgi:O-antigen ligase
MRLEYLKVGWAIAKANWPYGVGTGDTQRAFMQEYERSGSSLSLEWRHRAHNEYLTLWITFGVFGLAWSLFCWCWPVWRTGAWRHAHFIAWAIIFGISCLTDDTIETQAGATFFGLYYALFVFAAPRVITAAGSDPTPVVG